VVSDLLPHDGRQAGLRCGHCHACACRETSKTESEGPALISRGKKSPKQKALLKLRKDNCAEYHANHKGGCEVSDVLRRDEACREWMRCHRLPGLELNHIFGRGTEDHESLDNYIMVERAAHNWGHDVSPRAFELACLYVKVIRSKADVELLESICGHSTLRYRVEYLADGQSEAFQDLAKDLLAVLPPEDENRQ